MLDKLHQYSEVMGCVGKLVRVLVDHSEQLQRAIMLWIESQSFLGKARRGGRVPAAMRAPCVPHDEVGILKIELPPRFGLAEFQFSLPLLFLFLVAQAFFLAFVFTTTGVPRKPNRLRIWLIRYRSCEKCNGPALLVNSTNVGGRTPACVI